MSLVHQVHTQFEEVGDRVHHVLAMTAETESNFEEVWYAMRGIQADPASELGVAVTQLEVAYAALAEARTLLSGYPDIINPYLARIGMEQLSITPPIPQQAQPPAQEAIKEEVKKRAGRRKSEHTPKEPPKDKYLVRAEAYAWRLAGIRDELDAGKDPHTIGGYIGSGGEYYVFNNGDGTVLKVPRDRQFDHIFPDYERTLAGITKGNTSFEQILGFTPERGGAFLTRFVPGQRLEDVDDRKLANAPKKHYYDLARAIGYAVKHGLSLEYRSTSTLYDSELGFVFIDNAIGNEPSDLQRDIDTQARMALVMFGLGEADQKTAAIEEFKLAYSKVYPGNSLGDDPNWWRLGA